MYFHNRLFAGTYLYFIKVENGSKISFSNYFAYSTLIALFFFHMLFLFGFVLFLSQILDEHFDSVLPNLMQKVWFNAVLGSFLFGVGWISYIRDDRYKGIVAAYKNDMEKTIKFAMLSNALMASMLIVSVIVSINSM